MVPRAPAQSLREQTRRFAAVGSAVVAFAALIGTLLGGPWPLMLAVSIAAAAFLWRDDLVVVHRRVQGAVGEETVGALLAPLEAEGFVVVHDLDTGRGNVDHVVVGPTGIFVIETKAWTGRVYLKPGPRLMCGAREEDRTISQVLAEVFEVRRRLRHVGMDGWVEAFVALTATRLPKGEIDLRGVRVVEAAAIPDAIRASRPRFTETQVARAAAVILRGDALVEVRAISLDA
jgi:hypothetical protein